MNQADIIRYLNNMFPFMDQLVETKDIYETYDCENNQYLIEIKSRDKHYDPWIIEKKKYVTNLRKANETNKEFIYLTEYRTKIMTWNITNLSKINYDFKWENKWLPISTIPMIGDVITGDELKSIGYLYEKYAKKY